MREGKEGKTGEPVCVKQGEQLEGIAGGPVCVKEGGIRGNGLRASVCERGREKREKLEG